uniref:Uncharacterized protein n=1 Tax=Ralstonia solanacearum TaxID=305 RepID=A0A0S4TZM5_RALSL|nr:protein of unknown function [Ralstonia solanacearum]
MCLTGERLPTTPTHAVGIVVHN